MNNEHNQAVFCIAESRPVAKQIVEDLKANGFRESEISLVMGRSDEDGEIGVEGNTKAPEGATIGSASGATIGGALGWMAGIGALAIPGLGPFIAAGPILAALSGAAIGGAAIGGAAIGGAAIGGAAGGVSGGLVSISY